MAQVIQLGVVILGFAWLAAEVPISGKTAGGTQGPEWRRTNDGWIKVGNSGAAALMRPDPQPASTPALHPAVVAVFMLLSGVVSLSLFDRGKSVALVTSQRAAP